jgi:LPXTG-motif cell wall-anchored protein
MKSRIKRNDSLGALDLIDEAVHLLRRAPFHILLNYFIGSGPFVLGVLYFWTDMAMSPFAVSHCAEAAVGVTLLYVWMKSWQSIYAVQLYAHAANLMPPQFGIRRILRMVLQQTALQPYSLFLLPLSALAFFPFGWVYAFYQNLSVTGSGDEFEVKQCRQKAWALAKLWPGQNHRLIAIVSLFALVVFVNLRALLLVIPFLIRTFFGIETAFTLSGEHLLNTTFATVVWGISYLCVNPLVKAAYVLRCFYGEALKSGADLSAEVKSFRKTASVAVMVIFSLFLSSTVQVVLASERTSQETISVKDLNEAIGKTIQKREYQWRIPKEKNLQEETNKNIALEFLQGFFRWFVKWWNTINDWIDGLFRDLRGKESSNASSDFSSQKHLWYILAGVGVLILFGVLWILWKRKKEKSATVPAEPLAVLPDVTDENVLANQLPEEEWQTLARNFLMRGELRLALRALFLATLAALSRKELISIAKFKSNMDYQKELRRRARARSELQDLFSQNVSVFESSWYGKHEVNREILRMFGENQDRIRQLVQE